MAAKKKQLFDSAILEQEMMLGNLSERELYLCGLALYWGEGGKTIYSELTFTNTDPRMIRFYLHWLREVVHCPEEKIKVKLHLYRDMDFESELEYWMKITGVKRDHFTKPYIKATTLKGLTYKSRGHGTCNLIAGGLTYSRPVFAAMEVLSRKY
jgi:hypothetical protein